MVDQTDDLSVGRLLGLTVKVHLDDMKRVTIREQNYFYHNISERGWWTRDIPFTLGIAFPSKYGQFRVTGGTEMARNMTDGGLIKQPPSFFSSYSRQSVQL